MKYLNVVQFLLLITFGALGVSAQEAKYPPLSEYLMPQDAEIALAKSAAPDNISGRATIKVLTPSGFQVVHEGDNRICVPGDAWVCGPDVEPLIRQFREKSGARILLFEGLTKLASRLLDNSAEERRERAPRNSPSRHRTTDPGFEAISWPRSSSMCSRALWPRVEMARLQTSS